MQGHAVVSVHVRLDLSSLEDAVAQLETSLRNLHSHYGEDPALRPQLEAGTIQAFEFVYELATKTLRRSLASGAINPAEVQQATFMPLLRMAADAGLPVDPTAWHGYRDVRNRTSHTYDQEQAQAVIAGLPAFLADAKALLAALEEQHA